MYCNKTAKQTEAPLTYDDELLIGTISLFTHFNKLLKFVEECSSYGSR